MHKHRGYDENMPAKAREMWLGQRAQRAGVTYLEEGTHAFTLSNGAKLCVSHLSLEACIEANGTRSMHPHTSPSSATGRFHTNETRIAITPLTNALRIPSQPPRTLSRTSPIST
jgi:hypothetical protein